jgi:hypothetical protein
VLILEDMIIVVEIVYLSDDLKRLRRERQPADCGSFGVVAKLTAS